MSSAYTVPSFLPYFVHVLLPDHFSFSSVAFAFQPFFLPFLYPVLLLSGIALRPKFPPSFLSSFLPFFFPSLLLSFLSSSLRRLVSSPLLSMQIASAVSGKTNYLVAGTLLDDGRPVAESSKYRTAIEKKVLKASD